MGEDGTAVLTEVTVVGEVAEIIVVMGVVIIEATVGLFLQSVHVVAIYQ